MTSAPEEHGVTCPDCGSRGVPIFYGDPPEPSYLTAEEHGRLVLGGAMPGAGRPTWACSGSDCSLRWSGPDPLRAIQQAVQEFDD
jgi:hypothetical protein